jgi:glycosyltransferase involved in cell wall biosynthesis
MKDLPDYSVLIPAFDEEHLLPATLASVQRAMESTPLCGEIIVCDNNSRDKTADVARAAGARVVFEPVNQISRARNTGARAARGRFLVFLDADSELPPDLLSAALRALQGGRVVGGGAQVEAAFESHWARTALALWNATSTWRRLAAGSFVFCLREAFEGVGGFSERVYASEEIWLSRALKKWGRRRGLDFIVFDEPRLKTSPRKDEWYPTPLLVLTSLLFLLLPFLVLSRRFCWLWYRRPGSLAVVERIHDSRA